MTEPSREPPRRQRLALTWMALVLGAAPITIGLAALLTNIFERKQEARNPFYRVVTLTDSTTDPAEWERTFPFSTTPTVAPSIRCARATVRGDARTPSDADPRMVVAQSRLEEDPRLREFWAGYVREGLPRGTRTCLHARRPDVHRAPDRRETARHVPNLRRIDVRGLPAGGRWQPRAGLRARERDAVRRGPEAGGHPVACIGLPRSEQPAAARRVPRSWRECVPRASEGVASYDVNRDASRQEMRTFVCGQCHVEYYQGPEKKSSIPGPGSQRRQHLAYYEANGHRDWVHAASGAPTLKAQHPEFETYNQEFMRAGVACADCHMPYTRTGAMKVSDHHVRSPLLNINRACQTCHRFSEEEMRARVERIQDRTFELRNLALDAVLALTRDIATAAGADSANPRLATARTQRKAQFLTDFVEAENSMGFHALQEAARLLGHAIDYARRAGAKNSAGTALRALEALSSSSPSTVPSARSATATRA